MGTTDGSRSNPGASRRSPSPKRRAARALITALCAAGGLTAGACRHPPADGGSSPRDRPVAQVGKRVITLGEMQQRLDEQSVFERSKYKNEAAKQEFLEGMVRSELLTEEAIRRGYDKDPEVIKGYRQQLAMKLVKDELMDKLPPAPTKAEVEAYYVAHPDEFRQERQVRAQQIVVADKAAAMRVLAAAKRLTPTDAAGFGALVTQYSIDKSTKDQGGDLRFMDANSQVRPALLSAILALKTPGQIAGPVEVEGTFRILRLADVREAGPQPLSEAEAAVRRKLTQKAQAAAAETLMAGLRKNIEVKLFPETAREAQVKTAGGPAPSASSAFAAAAGASAPAVAPASEANKAPFTR